MLSNAYLLAKFRFDTAENERNFAEILPKTDTSKLDPTAADRARCDAQGVPRSPAPGSRSSTWRAGSPALGLRKQQLTPKGCVLADFQEVDSLKMLLQTCWLRNHAVASSHKTEHGKEVYKEVCVEVRVQ